MCGLTGFWQPGGCAHDEAAETARRMADALVHRGPDDAGVWVDASAGLALGHRRLAILDLSPAGHQPMVSDSGRYVIAFNGEIYNHRELRAALEGVPKVTPASADGVRRACGASGGWRGHSDTETLLAAIETWGIEQALQRCVGMFALALWDRQARTLTLARDRLGEKPLYYGWQDGVFLFGSELKALRAH
ncbi:MAG: asparagine synthetase B, partial [Burkholderiales bacterium]|nr:asparagine synthetase B [Burkholderiales bacterium]